MAKSTTINALPELTEDMIRAGSEALFRVRTTPRHADDSIIDSDVVILLWNAITNAHAVSAKRLNKSGAKRYVPR